MTYDFKAIDAVCNYEFDDNELRRPDWSRTFITEKIGADPSAVAGYTDASFIEKMDRAGIEHVFLIAVKAGSAMHKIHRHISYERVAAMVQKHPTRFSGLAGVDPTEGMKGVRALQRAVEEYGFIGAHTYPHWFEIPPDHAKYYPFYAKCVELGIPIQLQVGQSLVYDPDRPLRSVGRPITLDAVACDFPELKLVGIHIGIPWTDEMIAMAWKHPNVYIAADAYAPKHWPAQFGRYIDSYGQDKVMFGTDFPVLAFDRMRREVEALNLRPEPKRKFLRDNAARIYGLKL